MDLRSTYGLITALRSKQWQQEIEITWGVLGNGAGTVQTARTNYYYVLPQGLQRVAQAINLGRVPPIPELMVELAEKDGAYAILGPAMQLPYWGDADPYLPLHGPTHEAGEGRGRDPVNVYLRAITSFRADVHSPADDSLAVAPGRYYDQNSLDRQYFPGGNSPSFNLASSGSVSGSGSYRWDLLYLNTSINSLAIERGIEGPPGFITYPNPPWSGSTASIPITYVRTCYGETTIEETDLEDARQIVTGVGIPQNAGWLRSYEICSGSPPANGYFLRYDNPPGCWRPAPPGAMGAHNLLNNLMHPDTVAQGVTRGSLIYGDATPSWNEMILGAAHQLLKVNAAGTDPAWAAFDWDDIAAAVGADMVHDHSALGEGGQLDWDTVWSDDIHDHSAAGEGGQIDVADLIDSLGQLLTGVQKTDLTDGGQTVLHSHAGVTTSSVQVTLLNNSGFGLVSGDVVVTGSAINESVVGTTQPGYCGKVLVAAETIVSGSLGLFWERGGPFDIRTIGVVNRNDGLRTSSTRFRAASADGPCSGSVFAVALSPAVGDVSGSVSGLFLDAVGAADDAGGAGTIEIQEDDAKVTDATIVNFEGGGGKVTDEGGGKVTVNITPGGGGAADFTLWEPDAPPTAPSAYDDEFSDASFNAVLWTEFDPADDLTISENETGLIFDVITDPGNDWCGVYQSIPAGDFSIVAKLSLIALGVDYAQFGLVLWDDATNATAGLYTLQFAYRAAAPNQVIWASRWTNYTTWAATLYDSGNHLVGAYSYLRIRRVSTTYYFDWSADGVGWVQMWSGTLVFTPDHFGIGIDNTGQGVSIKGIAHFFRYTNSGALTQILQGDRIDCWRS